MEFSRRRGPNGSWEQVPGVEKAITDDGISAQYWLEVSAEEQTRRLQTRIDDPRKVWRLSDLDLKSYSRWYDYSRARDAMFPATDTAWAPGYIARTDDKKRGRLNMITHLLSQVHNKPLALPDVTLPKRQRARRRRPARPATAIHPDTVLTATRVRFPVRARRQAQWIYPAGCDRGDQGRGGDEQVRRHGPEDVPVQGRREGTPGRPGADGRSAAPASPRSGIQEPPRPSQPACAGAGDRPR